jgi:DNA-binding MarR family transcriptional regulator
MPRRNEAELRAIDEFIEYIETVARTPYQRDRALGAAGMHVSGAGLNALRLIAREGPLPVNEVARRMGVDQSTASRQIRPLEDSGLVERTADEADRRVAWLDATAHGRALLDRVHGLRRDDIEFVLGEWPARDRTELARLLDKFKQAMVDAPNRRAAAG